MKPIRLSFQAFGPYLHETEIDFSTLEDIFLICGPTGGGKTSILDAMCFALYCRATGGKRDFKSMRCNRADKDTETFVEYDFKIGEEIYRFHRSHYMHINRRSGNQETRETHACYKKKGDSWELIESGSEAAIRKRAEELLNLSCEQFSQVIVLPQGDFLKFLRANSRERGAMLETLFSADIWERITSNAKDRVQELQSQGRDGVNQIESILKQEGCETEEELAEKEKNVREEIGGLEKSGLVLINKAGTAKRNLDMGREFMDLYRRVLETRRIQEKKASDYKKAEAMSKEMAEKAGLEDAYVQEKNKIIERLAQIKEQHKALSLVLEQRKKAGENRESAGEQQQKIEKLTQELDELEKRLQLGREFLEKAQEASDEIARLAVELTGLEQGRQAYTELARLENGIKQLKESLEKDKTEAEERELTLKALEEKLEYQEVLRQQNTAYLLSQKLEEHVACPVCGSTDHPAPARAVQEQLTEEEFAKLRSAEKATAAKLQKAKTSAERSAQQLEELEAGFRQQQEACKAFVENSLSEINEKQEEVNKQLEDAKGWKDKQEKAKEKLEGLQTNRDVKIDEKNDAAQQAAQLIAAAKALEEDMEKSELKDETMEKLNQEEEALRARLEKCNNMIEKLSTLREDVAKQESAAHAALIAAREQFDTAMKEYDSHGSIWSHEKLPEILKMEEAYNQLQKQSMENAELLGNTRSRASALKKSLDVLVELKQHMEKLKLKYDTTAKLYKAISGENPYKTPILLYSLSIMLEEILYSANRFFDILSRGRYSLTLVTEQGTGRGQKGLDIEVMDAGSMSQRSIETLSGGEQFLASLSLAFGLSDTVQSHTGAVRLDSLFIDEGFGTLDAETLDITMRALMLLRKGGRSVGIISHVAELKNRIGTRLEVGRDSNGNTTARVVN